MEKKDVPQDGGSKYGDLKYRYYVPDENGDIVCVNSSGWERDVHRQRQLLGIS